MTISRKPVAAPQLFKVNSFVAEGCLGNPAGVCLLPKPQNDSFYERVAVKLGAAETAFVVKDGEIFQLKWFTCGGVEVALCGHATLAAAGTLWLKGYAAPEETIRFSTKSGVLKASKDGDFIVLDFPREKIVEVKQSGYDFKEILGFEPLFIATTSFDFLVIAPDEETVKNLKPDIARIKTIKNRGVIVSARSSNPRHDFVSRFFAPQVGIDEDPVTGSAHCALAPYWGKVLHKDKMIGYQASARGGIVGVTLLKDRVLLVGKISEVPLSAKEIREILSG